MVDIFYKPPLQNHDECEALEENYMNCLLQKALRDKVYTNRCVLDSVLWFHLECPKAIAKFDNPLHFRRKWRDFFSEAKNAVEMYNSDDDATIKVREETNFIAYPEDIIVQQDAAMTEKLIKKFSPMYDEDEMIDDFEDEEDEEEPDDDDPGAFLELTVPKSQMNY